MDFVEVLGGGPGYTTVRGADGNIYTVRGTLGYRQNNPGNLRYGPFSQRHGAIGAANGFSVFPSYQVGRAAKEALLFNSKSYAGKTLRQAIQRYAPPTENATSSYVGAVARALGVDPDAELSSLTPEQRTSMLDAMERVEGFRPGGATDALGNPVDLAAMPNPNIPTPEFRQDPWTSAVPGEVERGLLSDVPSDLQAPAVTPTEAYGLLASSMGQTPSLNLSGAGIQSPVADRMAGGIVANGMDGLRSGLLASGSVPSAEAQLAEMQTQANLQNEVNMARGRVSQDQPFQAYRPEQQQTANSGLAAIEAISPTTQGQTTSLADAYRQMGQTMEQGGILGASGLKVRDPNDLLGVGRLAQNPLSSPVDNLPDYQPQAVDTAIVEGPVTTGAIDTPEAAVEEAGALSTTPQTTQQQPSRFGRFARNAGASLLGGLVGSTVGGPIGGLIGSALAKEALGVNNQQGGLLGGGLKGLLGGDSAGQGAWAGVGTLNNLGSGAQASYGAWGGPKGTTATASDGSRITNLGNGLVSRIDRFGRETLFRDGETVGGGGGWGSGLLGGLFGGNSFGDGSRSQADKARDSVGLY